MKVLCVPKKTVSGKEKEELKKLGFYVIVTDNPNGVILKDEKTNIKAGDLGLAALAALVRCDSVTGNTEFIRKLYAACLQNADKKDDPIK